ncbi:ATP-dependent DNA helicase PIF1-like [Abrus precatorius]|uniref:ATP-dependent DNA helicase n=1 Tax=Abrus precatorius TaxID=3816 RepID=A0A8B8KGB6_ABRPR|nr:ATP-dependent DNA helicase PIF1-like [Abrus precatorius]
MRFFTLGIVVAAYSRNLSTKGYSSRPLYGFHNKYKYKYKNKDKTSSERKQIKPIIQWTEEQRSVLSAVTQGSSVFITGSAGTGKTKLLSEIVKLLKKLHTPSKVFVTASTGVAAFAIKGQTLHSFAGIRKSSDDPQNFLKGIRDNRSATRRWKKVEALVIDEISMVDARLFDNLEFVAKELKGVDETWGGIQLVVVGDFCQLPPIPDRRAKGVMYAFEADCWNDSFDLQIEITKIFRQSDPLFIQLLQGIRMGESDRVDFSLLEKFCSKTECDPSAVQLFPLKKIVETVNKEKLKSLQKDVVVYRAVDSFKDQGKGAKLKKKDQGKSRWKRQLELGIAPGEIAICEGARVMLVKNLHTWKGLVNGATGTVMRFVEAGNVGDMCSDKLLPEVKFDSGKTLTINPEEWHVMDGDEVVATRKQIPLILSWALSIHKCQGMTLDKAKIDLSKAFGCGMVYTALSRVKNLGDLHLSGFKPSKILADPKVSQFYRNLALQCNSKDLHNSCIESKDSSSSVTGDSDKAGFVETKCYFSLSEFLARRLKRS